MTLAIGVGRLDACPRLDQGHGRRARCLTDRDEEPFAGVGLDDHPLVEQDVFLEPALEVVAEGGVRGRGREMPVVGLDQATLAHTMAAHPVAHRDDVADGLMSGHRRQPARHVGRYLRQHVRIEPGEHLALTGVACERMQELRVGEADPDRLHAHEDLVRSRPRHRLRAVVNDLARTYDLDRVLRGGNGPPIRLPSGHSCAPHYFSITWPPVTGTA